YKEGQGGGQNPGNVPVTGVTVNPPTAQVEVGQSVQLNASVAPSNATNKQVPWSVSGSSIASVSPHGLVTGLAQGTTTVPAPTADGNKAASATITVAPAPSTVIVIGDEVKGLKKIGDDLLFYVNGATFADLHYKVNNGGQLNVA
ncbi:glycoside hydrolase family 16 protein, partial [Clostridium perfringens]